MSFWKVKTTIMTIVLVHARPFTTSVPYSHLHMMCGGSLMESFTRLLQRLVILHTSQCFMEVDAGFDGVLIRNTNIDTEQQSTTTTRWEGHQTSDLGISDCPPCLWELLCTGVESNGGESMWKFDDFIVNLGGRRHPRRVMAYNSTNNHELDNTFIEPHRDIYLVEFYW